MNIVVCLRSPSKLVLVSGVFFKVDCLAGEFMYQEVAVLVLKKYEHFCSEFPEVCAQCQEKGLK